MSVKNLRGIQTGAAAETTSAQVYKTWRNIRHCMTHLPQAELRLPRHASYEVVTVEDRGDAAYCIDTLVSLTVDGAVLAILHDTGEAGNTDADETEIAVGSWVYGADSNVWELLPGWTQVAPHHWRHTCGAAFWEAYDDDADQPAARKRQGYTSAVGVKRESAAFQAAFQASGCLTLMAYLYGGE